MSAAAEIKQAARALRSRADDVQAQIVESLPDHARFLELSAERAGLMREATETVMGFRKARHK